MVHKLVSAGGSQPPNWFLNTELATIGSVLAAGMEIMNGALQSPTRYGVILFVLLLLLGTAALIWFNRKKHGVGNTIIIVVAVILFSVLMFGLRTMAAQGATIPLIFNGTTPPAPIAQVAHAPTYYYMEVITYVDDDGDLDGKRLSKQIVITTRDPTDLVTPHRTSPDGTKEILLRNAGYIRVAVCGVYQTQFVPDTSIDRAHAVRVEIGLSSSVAAACS